MAGAVAGGAYRRQTHAFVAWLTDGARHGRAPGRWTPPADYTTRPELPEDDDDYSPALERALAAAARLPRRTRELTCAETERAPPG